MAVTTVRRPKVTAAFLTRSGGYLTDGMRLLRVLAVPRPNDQEVLLEDCYRPIATCAVGELRSDVLKMRVVRWPEGLDDI